MCTSTSFGVVLAASAIVLISFGFNNLNGWGLALATANAPFDLLGLSAGAGHDHSRRRARAGVPDMTRRRQAAGKTPLLALEVIDSPEERCAVYALFAVVALEAALNSRCRCISRSSRAARRWRPPLR